MDWTYSRRGIADGAIDIGLLLQRLGQEQSAVDATKGIPDFGCAKHSSILHLPNETIHCPAYRQPRHDGRQSRKQQIDDTGGLLLS